MAEVHPLEVDLFALARLRNLRPCEEVEGAGLVLVEELLKCAWQLAATPCSALGRPSRKAQGESWSSSLGSPTSRLG